MEKINFQDMSFDATHQAIIAIVNEKSEFLSDQQIKDAQYDILEFIKQYNHPPHLMINLQYLRTPVHPELQEWIALKIIPKILKMGILKIAYIMPMDEVEKISVEQITDEVTDSVVNQSSKTAIAYFDNEQDAFKWFTK
jgi:hypothetical protein